ncbi:MAG: hypothetical protein A2156_16110 [Deltaproteobacteria bacterium RBG_16_48_10]|nr:MAG: hypothetical protein A2156_16110 [Deltaproteobacteria bacterium RBG_16_48_10]
MIRARCQGRETGDLRDPPLLYTSAINTGWIIAIQPIFIAHSGRIFLGEKITWEKVLGIIPQISNLEYTLPPGRAQKKGSKKT